MFLHKRIKHDLFRSTSCKVNFVSGDRFFTFRYVKIRGTVNIIAKINRAAKTFLSTKSLTDNG